MALIKCGKESVYREYGMTPSSVAADLASIKAWLLKQPHLPLINRDLLNIDVDEWLENYLITSKNSVERVKENLDMYFTSKTLLGEVFTGRDPNSPAFRVSCDAFAMGLSPERSAQGRRLLVFGHKPPGTNDAEFDPLVVMKRLTMLLDVMLQEGVDYTGVEVLIDFRHAAFHHLASYNLTLCKKLADIGLKALPQRVFKIHIVNPNSIVELAISLFKPLVPKKLGSRVVVHRDLSGLQETLDASCIPSDYGGSAPSVDELNECWAKKMEEYRQWFIWHDSCARADESKRTGKCRHETTDSTFGASGSFRKIEVD